MDDTRVDLSPSDRNALTVLINEYADTETPIKSGRLAELTDRAGGSVQNQMRKLSSLGLVESVPGPQGGYEPTEQAYFALGRDPSGESEEMILAGNYDRIDVTIDEITLTNVHHPTECRARVHFQQLLEDIDIGDPIVLGPTPRYDLVVLGEVLEVLGNGEELLVEVSELKAPFER